MKSIRGLLAFGIATALLRLPEAYGQTCSGGLGERSFTIARPPSVFTVSALGGVDVTLDPWPEGPLRLCAGADQGNGVHPVSLMEDVVLGLTALDTSVLCVKMFATGSGGSIDCNGGSAHDVFSTQNSNHSGVADPPVVTTGLGADAGPGAATLTINMSMMILPAGSDPGECATQDYTTIFPAAFTTATATSEVTDAFPNHGTRTLTDVGSNFDCITWTLTDSPGTLVAPVSGLDTIVGDVAAALKLTDAPAPTGPATVCGDDEVNQASEQCDGTDADLCPGQCGVPGSSNGCLCPPDHYLCYGARQLGAPFAQREVTVEDRFGQALATVRKPQHVCNPADKNGEGIDDPTAHLMCYRAWEPGLQRLDVVVENQFGQQTLRVMRPHTLCTPAEKDAVPSALNIDGFRCYKVSGTARFPQSQVTVEDQFETRELTVVRPKYLCNPADDDGEGFVNPQGYLTCYKVRDVSGQPRFQSREVDIVDRFAQQDSNVLRARVRAPSLLCVPSKVSPAGDLEERVAQLVDAMTLEEKVSQMAGASAAPVAGVSFSTAPGVDRLGVPPLRFEDGPRGLTADGIGATTFPVGMARGATWEPEVERRVGAAMGRELKAIGGNVLLAPTINILRHPSWGRSQETYGEDVHHLSRMGVAFVQGVQEYVLANPKHYAANSIEDTRFDVDVTIDERTLREIYLPHFQAAVIEGDAASVMSAYNSVNGQFCGENEQLLRQILKGEWGFDGFVESDWVFGTNSTLGSALNGLDIEMPTAVFYGDDLLAAVQNGQVPESVIDDAVSRMVRKKLEHGLDQPSALDPGVLGSAPHLALAQEAAVKGAVLLKNQSNALPLDMSAVDEIAVVGLLADLPNTGDTGSSNTDPAFVVTPLEGIQQAVGGAVVVHHIGTDALDAGNIAVVAAADAVIVVTGLTAADEGEGLAGAGDRVDLALSQERVDLIRDAAAANDRTIVVLEGGGAITMGDWLPDIEALLMVWYPGQMGGHAVADLLFGAANPSGKLPITFPTGLAQLPPFDNVSLEVTYDYFHGYRYLDRNGAIPEFPFGFGLSYTTFTTSNLSASQTAATAGDVVRFSVDVTNTGTVAGTEVVQLYVAYPGSSVERSERELKGFAKIALGPGETGTAEIDLPVNSLAHYSVADAAWVLEGLDYTVFVGTSSRDLPHSAPLTVAAQNPVSLY